MKARKVAVIACSAIGIALMAEGASFAYADKGGNGGGSAKVKGNSIDIGNIHNIISSIGNQGIGNGNSGRSQVLSPAGGMPGSSNGGGMPGSNGGGMSGSSNGSGMAGPSNAGGNGRGPGADSAAFGSKQGKDVKDFGGKDVKDFRGKDATAESEAARSETAANESKARSTPLPSCT